MAASLMLECKSLHIHGGLPRTGVMNWSMKSKPKLCNITHGQEWRCKLKHSPLNSWVYSYRILACFYGYTQQNYGDNIAAAYYILSLKGGFRFAGQSEWFRSDRRGKFSWDFMNHRDTSIEEVDVGNTLINYTGLENLVKQRGLRTLSVSGCAEVDDWFLSRLYIFQDTLEELDISNCPRISVGGLAALQKLRGLRRLNVSSLPRLQNPGLVAILLEEMLPHCHVTAVGYDHSLIYSPTQTDG
uniref:distal membrane-arm assembly complex protein 2-like isoform X3 n=1 Tax=Oncorhynchus gorbuscha TaxID=8017 RepID=UPI001EAE8AF4|nr:distal membrane-arm assembly complex protein 2-like isoform X3 [Oncorhynchus gorbuscha]